MSFFQKTFALFILILCIPIFFIVTILIFLEDSRPILFKQLRVGKENTEFLIIKFRTMYQDSPNVASEDLKTPDKFILKSGKILRKLSIDELPNLINIIKGEMNFIGPRPALPSQIELNTKREQQGIHLLKPGITGWAQINGRDEIPIDEKVELDLYYLENKSLLLDAKIILKTIFKVFKSSNISH